MKITACLIALTLLTEAVKLYPATLYVSPVSPNPMPPYSSWATAATTIQEAIDAAPPGAFVVVTNGVYAGGVSVEKSLALSSINGAQFTRIDGGGTNRCLALTNGDWLWGFTFTNGFADTGAGALGTGTNCFLTNCVFTGNSATTGGGVYGAILYDCLLTGNTARGNGTGGGAASSTLYNCTVSGNSASQAGGVFQGTLYNSIVYDNTAASEPNYAASTLDYCCTTPLPAAGLGNITNAPLFVNAAPSDFQLQAGSACIDAGNNAYTVAWGLVDLAGSPRIMGAAVDMGAYEYSAPVITAQPMSQTVYTGTKIVLSANASGARPLSWQWWFNQAPLGAATSSNLTLSAVTTNQAGNYWAVVTNITGAATSQVAVITVLDSKPLITVQPVSQTVLAGSNVTFTVGAVGSLPLSWQWQFNGAATLGATNPSLALTFITTNQAGLYSVVITNALGSITSQVALLTVVRVSTPGTKYVWQDSLTPSVPYATWATAAHTIQDAVDAGIAGDTILVTNGVYASGGRAVGYDQNRVTIPISVFLKSVNGPQVTIIDGQGTNRCVALTNGVVVSGFTLTNGGLLFGGCGGADGTPGGGLLTNCVLTRNRGTFGGGAAYCTLYDCTLSNNSANLAGGGVQSCTLSNCFLIGNSAATNGSGAFFSSLFNCTLTGNSLVENPPGAAAYACNLYNCAVRGNSGTGAAESTIYNCTISGNPSGGASSSKVYNSILYYNAPSGDMNYDTGSSALNYCCTIPMPPGGAGNITNEPLFVDPANGDFHLQSNSLCINAGNNAYATGATDLDGNLRIVGTQVDIGAYEYQSAMPPVLTVQPLSQTAWAGTNLSFSASAYGHVPLYWQWWFNGSAVPGATNATLTLTSVGTEQAGPYAVVVSNVFGTATSKVATLTVLMPGTKYVWQNSPAPTAPYTNWATAAHNIQEAVDAAAPGNVVLATNGVYYSTVGISKPISLLSANGPRFTAIDGQANGRGCVLLNGGAMVSGFTLTNGQTWFGTGGGAVIGGGTSNAFVTNCVIVNSSAPYGGGAAYCTLYNCMLSGNLVLKGDGTAALSCTLYNCTVVNNGLGACSACTLCNCILYSNGVQSAGFNNYNDSCTLNYCCTMPLPTNGVGNITNTPMFVDAANGDFHLQPNSPCINAGNNLFAFTSNDLDGNPRIIGGTVDMGAYEFQGLNSTTFYSWLQSYGLPTDGSADYADSDGDGMNNWQEWVCGTNPTNAASVLRLLSAAPTSTNVIVTWQSVPGINYTLERSTSLGVPDPLATTNFSVVATNIVGRAGTTAYADTNGAGQGPFYFRVGVTAP
ncbi:MAG TPA: immunoglobulin domain-containing protein [Verrucomicrobiae bacterium]|nr:immunoglobulin domain-containing protein [Verrucomicrobiae bacterium]